MSQSPMVRPVSWLNAGVSFCVLAAFVLVGFLVRGSIGVFVGAVAFVLLSQLLRQWIPRHHRQAIQYCKRGEFEKAIPEFQKSMEFFRDHEWVDRFRAVTMLSASGMSYREMAMTSLGFCYGQIGDGANARLSYEKCLEEFPNNAMAQSALRLIDAAANSRAPSP